MAQKVQLYALKVAGGSSSVQPVILDVDGVIRQS